MFCFALAAKSVAIAIVGNAEIAVAVKAVFAFDNAFLNIIISSFFGLILNKKSH